MGQMAGLHMLLSLMWSFVRSERFRRGLVQHRNIRADQSLTMSWRVDSRRASQGGLAGQPPDAKRRAAAAPCPGRYCSSPSDCCDTGIECCDPHLSLKEVRSDFVDVLCTGLGVLSIVHINVQPCVGACPGLQRSVTPIAAAAAAQHPNVAGHCSMLMSCENALWKKRSRHNCQQPAL